MNTGCQLWAREPGLRALLKDEIAEISCFQSLEAANPSRCYTIASVDAKLKRGGDETEREIVERGRTVEIPNITGGGRSLASASGHYSKGTIAFEPA